MIFQLFPHTYTNFTLPIKRSKIILGSSFEQTLQTLSPLCFIPRFSHKAFLVLEKKIFKYFLPHMGMAAILFNGAEPFEQILNTPSTEGSK